MSYGFRHSICNEAFDKWPFAEACRAIRKAGYQPLTVNENGTYKLTIPSDPGVAVPGYWMLFALDSKGVPSVARIIHITNN